MCVNHSPEILRSRNLNEYIDPDNRHLFECHDGDELYHKDDISHLSDYSFSRFSFVYMLEISSNESLSDRRLSVLGTCLIPYLSRLIINIKKTIIHNFCITAIVIGLVKTVEEGYFCFHPTRIIVLYRTNLLAYRQQVVSIAPMSQDLSLDLIESHSRRNGSGPNSTALQCRDDPWRRSE